MKAKEQGATIIHVDPRSRARVACRHLGADRAGTDIVFLGGLINHLIGTNCSSASTVVHYTNASCILTMNIAILRTTGTVLLGWNPEKRAYEGKQLALQGGDLSAERDLTLQRPAWSFKN